jgi:hypothetical protein
VLDEEAAARRARCREGAAGAENGDAHARKRTLVP